MIAATHQRGRRKKMAGVGRRSKPLFIAIILVLILGTAIYFRLWSIDYTISTKEAELLRRQFDIANREAMDESAEWRLKYDVEVERATKCQEELKQIKESSVEAKGGAGRHQKLLMLEKENKVLLEQIQSLKKELEAERLSCKTRHTNKSSITK